MGWTTVRGDLYKAIIEEITVINGHKIVQEVKSPVWDEYLYWFVLNIKGVNCIVCYVTENGRSYKNIYECEYPFYFSCPLSFLDLCPVVDELWRESVRAFWEKNK